MSNSAPQTSAPQAPPAAPAQTAQTAAPPTASQQAFIQQAQKLINPATRQPYSMDDIQQMIQKKGIK